MSIKTDQGVMTVLQETVRFKKKSQVTIPKTIADELGLKEDDLLEARLEDGKIVLVPTLTIPKDQAWFWSKEWQDEEKEVDRQIIEGDVTEPMPRDEALSVLDRLMKRNEH